MLITCKLITCIDSIELHINQSTYSFCTEFEDDPDLYVMKPIKYVGIEVWQVSLILFIIVDFRIQAEK